MHQRQLLTKQRSVFFPGMQCDRWPTKCMRAHASGGEEGQKEIFHNNHQFRPYYSLLHPSLGLYCDSM